jgi:hypothetical protein
MSITREKIEHKPPPGAAAALTAKVSRLLLLAICTGPIAVFPIGLAVKGYAHFYGAGSSALTQAVPAPERLPN